MLRILLAANPYRPTAAKAQKPDATAGPHRPGLWLGFATLMLLPIDVGIIASIPMLLPIAVRSGMLLCYVLLFPVCCTAVIYKYACRPDRPTVAIVTFSLVAVYIAAANVAFYRFVTGFWENLGQM